jgi:hypothetical protein
MKMVNEGRGPQHVFVKWWRKENDFLDYDLIDRFLSSTKDGEEIGGVELMTMDDMWREVKRVVGKRVTLLHEGMGDRIQWMHKVKNGMRTDYCMYSPASLLAIFDVETHGNPVGA